MFRKTVMLSDFNRYVGRQSQEAQTCHRPLRAGDEARGHALVVRLGSRGLSSAGDECRLPFRPGRAAARMRGVAGRGARVHRRGARRRALGAEQRFRQPSVGGVQPAARRARLDRHDLAQALWRRRAQHARTLCRDRGIAGGRRAGRRRTGSPTGRARPCCCATAPRSSVSRFCRALRAARSFSASA